MQPPFVELTVHQVVAARATETQPDQAQSVLEHLHTATAFVIRLADERFVATALALVSASLSVLDFVHAEDPACTLALRDIADLLTFVASHGCGDDDDAVVSVLDIVDRVATAWRGDDNLSAGRVLAVGLETLRCSVSRDQLPTSRTIRVLGSIAVCCPLALIALGRHHLGTVLPTCLASPDTDDVLAALEVAEALAGLPCQQIGQLGAPLLTAVLQRLHARPLAAGLVEPLLSTWRALANLAIDYRSPPLTYAPAPELSPALGPPGTSNAQAIAALSSIRP